MMSSRATLRSYCSNAELISVDCYAQLTSGGIELKMVSMLPPV